MRTAGRAKSLFVFLFSIQFAAAAIVAVMMVGCGEDARIAMRSANEKGVVDTTTLHTEEEHNTESYDEIIENEFVDSMANPKSTFSIDVDTASYSNVRRMINEGKAPPAGAVRIEEMIN